MSSQPRRDPLPGHRGHALRVDPQQVPRMSSMDNNRSRSASMATNPSEHHNMSRPVTSAVSSYHQQSSFPTPISAYPHNQLPQVGFASHQEQLRTPQSAAQEALNYPAPPLPPPSQKENMLSGAQYQPYDRELILERERCNFACWRFNDSKGISPEERSRLFRDILHPVTPVNMPPAEITRLAPHGSIGENVVVDAPFNCDYGYNITIGENVTILKNCVIMDSRKLTIGNRCVIGPNVSLYTTDISTNPQERNGNQGPWMGGKPVTIQDDCFIGGSVTLLPGVTVGKGSTVAAGSVVTKVSQKAFSVDPYVGD